MKTAAGALGAIVAVLWLMLQPAVAQPNDAAKSDKLASASAKGDLLTLKPNGASAAPRAAAAEAAFAGGGSAAAHLIDVAVRDDGLWLNSFATRSMPLEALDCAMLSDGVEERLHLPADAVQRLAREELLLQTRICAVNGSLVLTCYGGTATVSLRPSQLGDGCGR